MTVEGIDHLAITVGDIEAAVDWYGRVLGAEPHYLDLWRQGTVPVVILQIGRNRLSLHAADAPARPHAAAPTVGAADVCFRWAGPIAQAVAHLEACGVPVEEGPVPRPASDGTRGESVYFRDADGNLLELLSIG